MVRARLAMVVVAIALSAAGCTGRGPGLTTPDIIFLATPERIGVEMLKVAGVGSGDVVYDLGSGDGRLVIDAARDFGARGVGVEIEANLVQTSRENALKAGVADRVRFLWQDLFATDISDATVVTIYLRDDVNLRLRPKLLRELRAGTRLVSHDFGMADWTPDRVLRVQGPDGEHRVLYWVVPADAAGVWRLALPGPHGPREATLTLTQRFQRLGGTVSGDGGEARPVEGALDGARLTVTGRGLVLEGRIDGETATGRATAADGVTGAWTGRRVGRP
jgi:SAM-dependent methyltransferase